MSKNYEKRGFEITEELKTKVKYYREQVMRKSLAGVVQGLNMSHNTWARMERGENISWDSWNEVYKLLANAKLIDINDIDLMSPDRMREVLRQYHISGTVQHSAIGTNAVNISGNIGAAPTAAAETDKLDEIMASDMCSECKIKAYNILRRK